MIYKNKRYYIAHLKEVYMFALKDIFTSGLILGVMIFFGVIMYILYPIIVMENIDRLLVVLLWSAMFTIIEVFLLVILIMKLDWCRIRFSNIAFLKFRIKMS